MCAAKKNNLPLITVNKDEESMSRLQIYIRSQQSNKNNISMIRSMLEELIYKLSGNRVDDESDNRDEEQELGMLTTLHNLFEDESKEISTIYKLLDHIKTLL